DVDVSYSAPDLEARATLTYDVTIPTPTSVNVNLENDALIISYAAGVNTSADPSAQGYFPMGSLASGDSGSWNVPGEGTTDDSRVYLPSVSMSKSGTSPTW